MASYCIGRRSRGGAEADAGRCYVTFAPSSAAITRCGALLGSTADTSSSASRPPRRPCPGIGRCRPLRSAVRRQMRIAARSWKALQTLHSVRWRVNDRRRTRAIRLPLPALLLVTGGLLQAGLDRYELIQINARRDVSAHERRADGSIFHLSGLAEPGDTVLPLAGGGSSGQRMCLGKSRDCRVQRSYTAPYRPPHQTDWPACCPVDPGGSCGGVSSSLAPRDRGDATAACGLQLSGGIPFTG